MYTDAGRQIFFFFFFFLFKYLLFFLKGNLLTFFVFIWKEFQKAMCDCIWHIWQIDIVHHIDGTITFWYKADQLSDLQHCSWVQEYKYLCIYISVLHRKSFTDLTDVFIIRQTQLIEATVFVIWSCMIKIELNWIETELQHCGKAFILSFYCE